MKLRLSALAACLLLSATAAHADGYTVRDGSGVLKTLASKFVGLVHHPLHVMEGLFGGVPTAVTMTNAGALDVTVVAGGSGTSLTKSNAADPTLTEGVTTNQVSVDLSGYARSLVRGTVTANIGTVGTLATAAKQPALGTAGTPSADVITVQGTGSGTALKVDGSAVTQPVSSATFATAANQASIIGTKAAGTAATNSLLTGAVYTSGGITLTTGQQAALQFDSTGHLMVTGGGGGTQFAEDSVHASGDLGTFALVVRSDTAASTAGTTGDYTAMITDATGHLWTHGVAVASDFADGWDVTQGAKADAAWTTGSGSVIALLKTMATAALDTTTPSLVKGSIASGSTASDPPVMSGCRASTALPTAVTDGQVVNVRCSKYGGVVQHPFTVRELASRSGVITLTSTTETSLLAAGGANVLNDMVSIKACNTSATATRLDVRDVTAGTVQDTWYLPAGQCQGASYTSPFRQTTANSAWTVQLSGAVTDVRVVAQFVQQ